LAIPLPTATTLCLIGIAAATVFRIEIAQTTILILLICSYLLTLLLILQFSKTLGKIVKVVVVIIHPGIVLAIIETRNLELLEKIKSKLAITYDLFIIYRCLTSFITYFI
jgi:hypothetical protein